MSAPHNYGRYYWCVKSDLSENGEIYLHADETEVTPAGDLLFLNNEGKIIAKTGGEMLHLVINK